MDIEAWFHRRGWKPAPFQSDVWQRMGRGESGLIHCTTGAGKTLAAWFGALQASGPSSTDRPGPRLIWVTPLRALAADTESALVAGLEGLGMGWTVARRTGDTKTAARQRIRTHPPDALVTTPESLCLMLSQPEFVARFAALEFVVVDEWHELLSTKRGVMLELALSRIRALAPNVSTWGLSATLGNLDEAAAALVGYGHDGKPNPAAVVVGTIPKPLVIETVLPPPEKRFPWAGHLGLALVGPVADAIRFHRSTLVFTNTRSQAEIWFHALSAAMPDFDALIALHHGSIDAGARTAAETGLASGAVRAVVATSSLDLGVDFSPVDCVVQIGSPKGVARLVQRAGRSGHRPGVPAKILCVPTHTLELAEIAAARELAAAGKIESREPLRAPLDVLCQHIATAVAGAPMRPDDLRAEIATTHAYQSLSDSNWSWALDFASRGGPALRAYPSFVRIRQANGLLEIADDRTARQHRLNIGTIIADASVNLRFQNGARLGSVEESFLSRIRPGDRFLFGGRCVALVSLRDHRATVKRSRGQPNAVPRWMGGKLPLSNHLSEGVRTLLERARADIYDSPEMRALAPVLEIQAAISRIPARDELLVEAISTREGSHLFFYPFEGRLVHEGLAALFAYRLARERPATFTLSANDHGFELLSHDPIELDEARVRVLADPDGVNADLAAAINASEMAKRRFREISRIACLVGEGFPGARKPPGRVTVSSSLLYEVFSRYDPENLLLRQAAGEALETALENGRLLATLAALEIKRICIETPPEPTPLAYPLFAQRLREHVSTESLAARVARIEAALAARARPPAAQRPDSRL